MSLLAIFIINMEKIIISILPIDFRRNMYEDQPGHASNSAFKGLFLQ